MNAHRTVFHDGAASPAPAQYVCADCDLIELGGPDALPQGWDKLDAAAGAIVRCADCNQRVEDGYAATPDLAPGVLAIDAAPAGHELTVTRDGWGIVQDEERGLPFGWRLHHGARIRHWPMAEAGAVAIHLVAGAVAGAEAIDDGGLFTLRAADLDALIAHLGEIRAELDAPHLKAAA